MHADFISDINKDLAGVMDYDEVDSFIVRVHWYSFAAILAMTFLASVVKISDYYPSPLSWRVISYPEAIVVIAIGVLATIIPTFFVGKIKNHYLWRVLVTFTLTAYAYGAVFLSGGSIEMHFIFFIIIALLAIYSDWRLGWISLVLVATHHAILNYVAPSWTFYYGRNDFAAVVHGVLVLIAVIFTTIISKNKRETVYNLKKAEARLDKLAVKEDLEALLSALDKSALVSAAYSNGNIYYANGKFVEVSKYGAEELIGQNHRVLKSGFHSPEFYKDLWGTITSGKVWRGEIKNKAKDGSFYWVDSTIVPILGPDGKPERYISVRILITEKKELEEKTKMLASIVEGTSQALISADLSGKVLNANGSLTNLLGYSLSELKNINYINLVDPKYRDAVIKGIGEMQKTKKSFVSEVEFIKKDETVVDTNLTMDLLYDEHGIPQSMYAFLNDVTERKLMEKKIEERAQESEKMNKLMVGREVAMIDLKNKIKVLEQKLSDTERLQNG